MRLDDYLSTVGLVKRRTTAKEMGSAGMLEVNGRKVKPAYEVKVGDIIHIKGNHSQSAEVLDIPTRSVSKEDRARYFKPLVTD